MPKRKITMPSPVLHMPKQKVTMQTLVLQMPKQKVQNECKFYKEPIYRIKYIYPFLLLPNLFLKSFLGAVFFIFAVLIEASSVLED